ncbi:dTMP kinase [Candidatus Liberibacter americanus]|uniref:dTMP kinase n=1 Tax=Candidatus Liberibacter americanus TaxID=309868 RepID=UPI0002C5F6E3|nr:dTMP kinase [Candidatus Liberibacter americanus]EMS35969.1 thymidylate kinase [Candidatus Liberibacter americanus PW_SP]
MFPGLFISFEGIEGAGKTTHISHLARLLSKKGYDVQITREPGGTPAAEAARHVLLSYGVDEFGSCAEAILFAAIRSDHVESIIRPALMQGKILLCDRFLDSSYAYQSDGNGSKKILDYLQKVSTQGIVPDCTIIMDLPVDIGLKRIHTRCASKKMSSLDRFEQKDIKIHEIRRQIFLDIARDQSDRCRIVNSASSFNDVSRNVLNIVCELIQNRIFPSRNAKNEIKDR